MGTSSPDLQFYLELDNQAGAPSKVVNAQAGVHDENRAPLIKPNSLEQEQKKVSPVKLPNKCVVIPKLQLDRVETTDNESFEFPYFSQTRLGRLRGMLDVFKYEKSIHDEDYTLLVEKYAPCLIDLDKKLAHNKLDVYMNATFWEAVDIQNCGLHVFAPSSDKQKIMTSLKSRNVGGRTMPLLIGKPRPKPLFSPTTSQKINRFNEQKSQVLEMIKSFVYDVQNNIGDVRVQGDKKLLEKQDIQSTIPSEQVLDFEFSEITFGGEDTGDLNVNEQKWNVAAEEVRRVFNWLNICNLLNLESVIYFKNKNNLKYLIDSMLEKDQVKLFEKCWQFIEKRRTNQLDEVDEMFFEEALENVRSIIHEFVTTALPHAYSSELDCIYDVIIECECRNLFNESTLLYFNKLENVKALSDKMVDQHLFYLFKECALLLDKDNNQLLHTEDEIKLKLRLERVRLCIESAIKELKEASK
jgi:hypothetical protein